MKMKRFLALVLAICLVLGMVPAPVYAEETTGEQTSNETPVETTAAEVPVEQSTGTALVLNQSESVSAAVGETLVYTFTPSSAGDYILYFDFAPANGVDFSMQAPCTVAYFVDTTSYHVLNGLAADQTYTFTFTVQEDAISNGSIGVSNISPLTGATLNYSEISGNVGDTVTVRAIPNGGSYPEFHWSVEDTSVATVSGSGCDATVTLKSAGSTTLRVTVVDQTDPDISYECAIPITIEEANNIFTLELNQSVAIPSGKAEYQFKFTAEEAGVYWLRVPAEADCFFGQAMCMAVSDFDYKNEEYHGRVAELSAGTKCTIYMWGNGGEIGQIELVKTQYAERIDVDQTSFVGWWNGNPPGVGIHVTCTLYPAGSVTREIIYKVENPRVAQVGKTSTINVYGIQCNGLGTTNVILSTYEGVSVTIPVEVKEPWVTGFTVDPMTMMKDLDTSDWTNAGDGTVYKVYNPETADPQVTVTYVDGRVVTCAWSELEARTGLHMDHVNPLSDTSAWEAGSHTWKVMLVDDTNAVQAMCDMTIHIVDNPVAHFTVEPVTFKEIVEQSDWGSCRVYEVVGKNPQVTITMSDGNVITCDLQNVGMHLDGYGVHANVPVETTASWGVGQYTFPVVLKNAEDQTLAAFDIPVTIEAVERQTLTAGVETTVSLNANEYNILQYTAEEDGYLWLSVRYGVAYYSIVDKIIDGNGARVWPQDHSNDTHWGEYFPVTKGQTYEVAVVYDTEMSMPITPVFMTEATDIQLETTEVEGYVGQTIYVPYTCIPAGSLAQLDYNNVKSSDTTIADYRGGAQEIGIGMNKAGKTTFTVTVGSNTHTINITVKDPEPMNLGDVDNVTLEPGDYYAIAFTAPTAEDNYYLCWDYQIQGIMVISTIGLTEHIWSNAGDYNRLKIVPANDNENCVLILKNTSTEIQTFDLYLGKGVELQPDDLVITGPTEVKYGTEEVELVISVPMFADFDYFNWSLSSGNAMINSSDNRSAMLRLHEAGTCTVSAVTDTGITAEHSVTVKPYGTNALAQWVCPGDGNTMSMDFTPTESGYYYLSCADDGSAVYSSIGVRENSEQPLNEFNHNGNGGAGVVYKLEANKTYTFVAHDVWSIHTFYMTKLDVATSVTVTPSITGKVHEQKQLQVTYTGLCKWSVKSSDESIVMTGGGNETSQEVFLLGEGIAQLIVTDQDGNTYICNVTVSGELGTEDMEIRDSLNGWDEMGLAENDSQTYNFTPNQTGLYWVNSELDHKLGIAVENGGNPVAPEYVFNHRNDSQKYGAVYSLTQGVTYQITFTSDHNMTTFVNAQYRLDADHLENYCAQISGDAGYTGTESFGLYNTQNGWQNAVGNVSVTSSDEKVIKITYADGGCFDYELTGGGEAQVTIAVNGITHVIPVSVTGITSITVDGVTMIQGADTSDLTFDNDDHVYKVYDPSVKNPEVHVYYSNGNSVTYYWNDIEDQLGLRMGHANDLATTEGWTPGAHTWTVNICGPDGTVLAAYDMTVTILENPIKSVTAQPLTLVEGMGVIIATGTPEGNVPYYDVDLYGSDTELTFTYSDDSVTTCKWWEALDMTGYRVESVSGWKDSRYWVPGNSYTWTVAIKDDMGNTYTTCDIPVHVQKLDRQILTLDAALNVSLDAYQHKILEFDATETGYLWLWTEGETFEVVNRILDSNFERIDGNPHDSGNKYGVYFPVTAGQHYDIYVYSPSAVSNSITATMMSEATDIQLEATEVVGYAGQQIVWVDFSCIPEGSLAQLDYNNVIVGDEQIVLCRTGSSTIGIEMLKAGSTTIDITVGANTHTIHVTVKEPEELESGDVKQLTLAPGETYGFRVTPDEDRDYIIAYDKNVRGISVAFNGDSVDNMPQTAEYHRSKLRGMFQGNSYTCVLRNEGDETQTFDLYLGKVTEPQQGDLTITGPTEVAYGEVIKLYVDMPMFVEIPWINWSLVDNDNITSMYSQDSWYYFLNTNGSGTVTVTAEYNGTVTATHEVTVKPYGSDAIQSWIAPGDGSDMTMPFTPAEDGWYWLNYDRQGNVDFRHIDSRSDGDQPLNQVDYDKNSGGGTAYKLEAGKTYIFVAYGVFSDHTFFMNKLDAATSVTVTPTITGKVHEQTRLRITTNGFCKWEVESDNENIVMTGSFSDDGVEVFLLGQGTATLTVTDQDGNKYTCQVTVSGELGTEDWNGWDEMGLAAGDSQTYNFTPWETGLYWVNSELGHNLGIQVEQNGVEIPAEYDYSYDDGNDIRGKVYRFVDGQTYQITFTSDHNMTTFVNAQIVHEANMVDCWQNQINGTEDVTEEIRYWLFYTDENNNRFDGVGQVTITSDNENVAKAISADGRRAVIQLVGEGSTTIYINVNGVTYHSIPVTVNPSLKATSFTVANVTMYERADTTRLTYEDGRVYMVYNPGYVNPYVTFELSDGRTFEGYWQEVEPQMSLRMGHAEVLENTASWSTGDHQWVVDLCDWNGKILGTYEITVTIRELPSTVVPMEQETAVTLNEGEATGLRVTPNADGFLCLWIDDRNADFEFVGVMDSAGLRLETNWLYDHENGKRGLYVAASDGVTYEFFVKANNGSGTANVTPVIIPATTDITLDTTEVVGYAGQTVTVRYEKTPANSIVSSITCTGNTNGAVAEFNGWGIAVSDVSFYLKSVGETVMTLKVNDKTYDIKITALEPPAVTTDTPVAGNLAAEETVVYAFTPAEDGNYIICVNNGINMDCDHGWQNECGTAEYNRKFLGGLTAGQTYYIVLTNYRYETQNYELAVGKAEVATAIGIVGNSEMIAGNGEQQALEITMDPKFGYLEDSNITWTSDDENVVRVDWSDSRSAYVIAQNPGTATITATSASGLSATFTITVKDYKESVDQWWTGNEGGGELNFSFTPDEDGYYHLHWKDVWGSEPVLTADGDQPLFFFEYGWSWSNGVVYQMEAGKTYNFHCDWINNEGQIYMKKVEMATRYELSSQSITGQVHGKDYFGVVTDGIPYWEMTSSNEDVVMVGPGGSDWKNILFVGEGTATLTVTDHLGGVHQCEVTVSGTMDATEFQGSELIGLKANDSMTFTFIPERSRPFWIGHELGKDLSITLKQNGAEVTGYTFETSREGYTGTVYQLTAGTAYELTVSAGDERVVTALLAEWVYEANQMNVEADRWLDLIAGDGYQINYHLNYVNESEGIESSAVGKVTVTSDNEAVVKVESYDGGRAKLAAVDRGTATVTFKLNGQIMYEITVTVTKPLTLSLNEKQDVTYSTNGDMVYALFTPEKTGYYTFYMDAPVSAYFGMEGYRGCSANAGVNSVTYKLMEGETYIIFSWLREPTENPTAKLWVTESDYITGLEVVQLPEVTHYAGALNSGWSQKGVKLKATWSDGTTSIHNWDELGETGTIRGHILHMDNVEHDNGTYTVSFMCDEAIGAYSGTLAPNPVTSIELIGSVSIAENTYGWNDGEFWYYSPAFVRDALKLKITYTDGTSKVIPASQAELDGYVINQDVENAQYMYGSWTKDTVNTITYMYMGHEATAEVKIVDNWVDSIEVSGTPKTEFRFGNGKYGMMNEDGYIFAPSRTQLLDGLTIKVTGTDGQIKKITLADLQWPYGENQSCGWYDGLPVEVYFDAMSYNEYSMARMINGPCDVVMTVRYGWKTATFTVSVLPKEDVHVHDIQEMEEKAATYEEAGNIHCWYCEACNTIFADEAGTVEITYEEVILPKLVKTEVQKEELDQQIDEVLNDTSGSEPVKEVVVQVQDSSPENSVVSVALPTDSIQKIVDANSQPDANQQVALTVELNTATVTLDSKALETITEAAGDSREITLVVEQIPETQLTESQQNAVAEQNVEMVISAELLGTDGVISDDFGGGTATVQIPFTPAEGSSGSDYKILYVADDGTTEEIDTTYVDGYLVFTLSHFSEYVVVDTKAAPVKPTNPFTDVKEDDFYYDPVMWAVQNGITTGATATTFDPNGTCLRAQVVTFLHRAAGNPAPTSSNNPFTDVKSTDFFYKPVLWAVEKGITNGTSATTFGSYDNCNRAAVVTFLWRAKGCPEPKSTNNPFVDVKSTDFYYKAVLWAVEKGITNGVDTTHFGPAAACNRAQVVTFLYRAYN